MSDKNLAPNRRDFMQAGAAAVAAVSLAGTASAQQKNGGECRASVNHVDECPIGR